MDEEESFADAKSVESLGETGQQNEKIEPSSFLPVAGMTSGIEENPVIRQQSPVIAPSVQAARKPLGKGSKLGAVKANVNFDQLEAQAREDQKLREVEKEEKSRPPFTREVSPITAAPIKQSVPSQASTNRAYAKPSQPEITPSQKTISKEQQAGMERLGMGMRKMNLAQTSTVPENTSNGPVKYSAQVLSDDNQRKATGVKSMSSDKYFNRDSQEADYVAQERLRNIQGATSVSSSSFFKQEEEEEMYQGGGATGILSRFQTFFREELLGDDKVDDDSFVDAEDDDEEEQPGSGPQGYSRLSSGSPRPTNRHF